MKKILLAFFILLSANAFAQQKGIGYQAVILNPKDIAAPGYNAVGTPLANKSVCMSFQILNTANQVEYQEAQTLTTDQFGMVNLVIGNGTKTAGTATSLATVTWGMGVKTLVVGVNTNGACSNYTEISRQALNYSPYALYAEDANIKDGAITTAKLADGSVTDAKVAMGINKSKVGLSNVDNTSDALKPLSTATQTALNLKANTADLTNGLAAKVDKVSGKDLSTNDYTTAEKTKLAAITGTNTGDQDLSSLATAASVALKANASDLTNGLAAKVDKVTGKDLSTNDYTTVEKTKLAAITGTNTGDQDLSSLATVASVALKANASDLTNGLAAKVDKVTGKDLSTNDYTTAEKTKLAAITGTNTGDQDLSALATAASVALKANINSPSFSGVPTAPTAASTNNTTQIATTAFVTTATAGKFVDLTTSQTIAGVKTFSADISVNGLAIGKGTGQNDQNTAIGAGALSSSNVSGTRNTAVGYLALKDYRGTSFDNNTGVGYFNMIGLTTGGGNTSIGAETMFSVGSGSNNTGIGNQSLINTSGNNNVGVGTRSGDGLTTGSNNTFLGTQARTITAGATISNATALGFGAIVADNNTIQLGNTAVSSVKTSGKLTTGTITLPNTDGTTGQVLSTNGSGVVAWSTPVTVNTSNFVDVTTNQTVAGNKNFTGNIGIGTSSNYASSKLHINGNGLVVWGGTGSLLDASGNRHGYNENVALTIDGKAGSDILQLRDSSAPNTLLVVDKDGKMGIGNTSPTEKLEVTGNIKTSGALTTGNITYPTSAGTTGQVLTADGSGAATWVSAKSESNAIICKIADAPNTILTIGGFEFRYSSNNNGGFIEVRSSGNDNMMVFCQKNTGSWDLGGSTSTQNYRANTGVYSDWSPVISLWGGSSWSDRVTLSVYDSFEATMFSMGNGPTIPSPLKTYKIYAAIDGYNQVFLKVDYTIN